MAADPAGVVCSERRSNGGADGRRETGKKDRGAREERNRTHEREHQAERPLRRLDPGRLLSSEPFETLAKALLFKSVQTGVKCTNGGLGLGPEPCMGSAAPVSPSHTLPLSPPASGPRAAACRTPAAGPAANNYCACQYFPNN